MQTNGGVFSSSIPDRGMAQPLEYTLVAYCPAHFPRKKKIGREMSRPGNIQLRSVASSHETSAPDRPQNPTMSLLRNGYTDVNRAFLQAFMSRRVLGMDDIRPILAAILSADSK